MQVNIPYIKAMCTKNPVSSIILSTTRTGPANLWRQIEDFFLKNEYSPENYHVPWKSMVGRCISYWNSLFFREHVSFQGCNLNLEPNLSTQSHETKNLTSHSASCRYPSPDEYIGSSRKQTWWLYRCVRENSLPNWASIILPCKYPTKKLPNKPRFWSRKLHHQRVIIRKKHLKNNSFPLLHTAHLFREKSHPKLKVPSSTSIEDSRAHHMSMAKCPIYFHNLACSKLQPGISKLETLYIYIYTYIHFLGYRYINKIYNIYIYITIVKFQPPVLLLVVKELRAQISDHWRIWVNICVHERRANNNDNDNNNNNNRLKYEMHLQMIVFPSAC